MAKKEEILRMFTLYYKPSDFPNNYVLRGFDIKNGHVIPDKEPMMVENEVEPIHKKMTQDGKIFLYRDEQDASAILGSYI